MRGVEFVKRRLTTSPMAAPLLRSEAYYRASVRAAARSSIASMRSSSPQVASPMRCRPGIARSGAWSNSTCSPSRTVRRCANELSSSRVARLASTANGTASELDGYSLHAAVRVEGRDRDRLEHLCRYAGRPAIAAERLVELEDGRV
ncbi:MAG: transposase, partial [Planctomycetes bacterium]|nr:transposase [Planctomycetota bacterium]